MDDELETLPPGVTLLRTFEGHRDTVLSVAFSSRGAMLASGSEDQTVKLWDTEDGRLLQTLPGHKGAIFSVAFDRFGETLASGSGDGTAKIWNVRSGSLLRTLHGDNSLILTVRFGSDGETLATGSLSRGIRLWNAPTGQLLRILQGQGVINRVVFDPRGDTLASGGHDGSVKLWDAETGVLRRTLKAQNAHVWSAAFHPNGETLASGDDSAITLWESSSGKMLRTLEGHTGAIHAVEFSPDGRLLVSKSIDRTIRVWNCETWETIAVIPVPTVSDTWIPALAFHPTMPLLAAASSRRGPWSTEAPLIHLWALDYGTLLGQHSGAVHHTTGKIVLVGDHSVGKSALGYRLIHGRFEKQESTHGQQFWVFPALGKRRDDGTDCEAILWDFAGQPDYRLVHALFVDNADLALVLFDASDLRDPLHGVGFWLKQLQMGESRCPIILVGAQTDRGTSSMTPEELRTFCDQYGITGPILTSAATGLGMEELVDRMQSMIPWDEKAATVTTTTFKQIKDYVLGLKETNPDGQAILTPGELRRSLEATDADWKFTDAEMLTAVGHLENYGYVKRLKTSKGELRVLLQPERLNNLASSLVLEARRNPKGLGALEEKRLLAGGYDFPELVNLRPEERDVLLDSAALLFLEHNVCFRETDPLRREPYLVFPELINLKKPVGDDAATEDGVSYTVNGPTENVFASLVVLLGYTHTFTRTAQWHNNARYEVGDGLVCGFRQEAERDGELDFALCFGPQVGLPVRILFQGLFESFLARRNLTVMRYEPVRCSDGKCGQLLDRSVVRQRMREGKTFACCNDCGEKLALPAMAEAIQLTREVKAEVEAQRRAAEQRTRFEQAIFRLRAYAEEQKLTPPVCFISYAWGLAEHERWVEKRLATDLQKAGIAVVLDRWHNAQIGASVPRFIEQIENADRIVLVGTPLYREKYENKNSSYVVAAEVDLINVRLIGTEQRKLTVLPLLLAGEEAISLPPLLHGRVYADFRSEDTYFTGAFNLIRSIYQLLPNHPAVADLRDLLREPGAR